MWSGLLTGASGLRPLAAGSTLFDPSLPSWPVGAVLARLAEDEDRASSWAARAAREALSEAAWSEAQLASSRTHLVVATTKGSLPLAAEVMRGRRPPSGLERAFLFSLAPSLARGLGMGGPIHTVSVACASGLSAVGLARALIGRGDAERVLVVGTDGLSDFILRGFLSLQALDPAGARPFDAQRAGLSLGEGAAAVALRASEGEGLQILGYAAKSDANHITGPARDGRGLVAALEGALLDAALSPPEIAAAVLHGTGTRFNDAMEGVAYARVFGPRALPVLSVKGGVGHTMGAAGLVNLVTAVRSVKAGTCPPSAGLEELDAEIPLDVVARAPRPLASNTVLTSASGFAGVNAAVIVGPGPARDGRPRGLRRVSSPPRRTAALVTRVLRLPTDRPVLVERVGARSARRFDDLSLYGVAASDAILLESGLDAKTLGAARHALILGTATGCLESDHAFYAGALQPEIDAASPRLFVYTLPNIVLGEIAIRHQLAGENLVLSSGRASGLAALVEGARRIEAGELDAALVFSLEVSGAALQSLAPAGHAPLESRAEVWLLESAAFAEGRGVAPRMQIRGQVEPGRMGALAAAPEVSVELSGAGMGSTERLGGTGLEELQALVEGTVRGSVCVRCPSGYSVRVELEPV